MSARSFFGSSELVTDFRSFVASSRGISCDEAQQLIENWLSDYRPRTRVPIQVLHVAVENGEPCARASVLS